METKETILSNLAHCTGTNQYHRFSILFKKLVLTDGVKYLCDACQSYWLMDIIGSYQPKLKHEPFQVWIFNKKTGMVQATDGTDKKLASQKIEYTDFPLDEIKLYVTDSGEGYQVIMLTSEY